jgi:putative ABC transport system permease protein
VVLGLSAGVVGLFLGALAARFMMASFSQAVSELYFPVYLSWHWDPWVVFSSLILGVVATVLAALDPIWVLKRIRPVQFLRESAEEEDFTARRRKLFILGFILCSLAGVTQMATSFTRPYFSFITCLFFTLGWVFMAPAFLGFLSRLFDRLLPSTSLLKLNEVQKYLFRYAQVAASLIVAFSLTFAIIDMTQSFRHTVLHWLGHQFQADIFIAPADRRLNPYHSFLDGDLVEKITKSQEILYYYGFKSTLIPFRGGDIGVYITDTKDYFRDKKINRKRISIKKSRSIENDKMGRTLKKSIPVTISENFALRHGFKLGDEFTMDFPGESTVTFIVDAAFDDYTSEQGMMVIDKKFTQDFFPMDRFNIVHIFLKNPEHTQDFIQFSQREIGNQAVHVMSNGELRDVVLKIFDQTFFLAGSLKWLCFLVAFLGLLINLALLVEVRRKSLSLLRSQGMSRWQMMTVFFAEGTVVVTFVFLWAILESLGLLWILIYGVQKYHFSWIIEFHYTPQNWLWAFVFVLLVMLVMTVVLFSREFRKPIVEAIRYE